MAKLTDKQRKMIMAERASGSTLQRLAEKYHVSITTIRRTLAADPETAKMVQEKKEENRQDMLAFMDAQTANAQRLLSRIMSALDDPEKLADASPRDLATVFGIVVDKFTQTAQQKDPVEPVKIVIDV